MMYGRAMYAVCTVYAGVTVRDVRGLWSVRVIINQSQHAYLSVAVRH